ncbi:MAG: NAD(P)-dependent alcohol dehydrogenase [archaeon]|nr:MAG: NAD(P)-dependent alcohol dehydrogenase [archaeon]
MKAIIHRKYGSPELLELREVEKPAPTEERVLVKVKAASINPVERYTVRGPLMVRMFGNGLLRPKRGPLGSDLSGVVEVVGAKVTQFHPGDEVFGTGLGALAEYSSAREDRLVPKPARVSFEQAAAVPIAGITALQALRDWGGMRAGQKVLINGASGGVGSFAVQIAKSLGANVTGVCSTGNVEIVKKLGADLVLDYTKVDFVKDGRFYDLVIDNAGNRSLSDLRRVLTPNGTLVMNAGPRRGFIGFVFRLLRAILVSRVSSKKVVFHIAKINKKDLQILQGMMESGEMTPQIDRTYPLSETPDALLYLEGRHTRGKVVLTI